jgi:hypothetical protein
VTLEFGIVNIVVVVIGERKKKKEKRKKGANLKLGIKL